MNIINDYSDFLQIISRENIFEEIEFNLDKKLSIQSFNSSWITFNNCIFNCKELHFLNLSNSNLMLEFIGCTFNCDVKFSNSIIERVTFKNTKKIKSLSFDKGINESQKLIIEIFEFSNDSLKEELNSKICFKKCEISKIFNFTNVLNKDGSFELIENKIGKEEDDFSYFWLNNCTLNNVIVNRNIFNSYASLNNIIFENNIKYKPNKFFKNTFNKVDFSKSIFSSNVEFNECDFKGTTWFENCKSNNNSRVNFTSNKFFKYSLFDNSKFNFLGIKHCLFEEKVSFENIFINKFELHQVSFAKNAYFDDINKNDISNIHTWDRKTLRAIKREFANTNNQIEYLRFKAYELNAYTNEKGKNWKDNFILKINLISNNHGLDWIKGIIFIMTSGFVFYLLFLISLIISVKSTKILPLCIEDFFVTYLKFINPISLLKSPIESSESYFFPLLFFIVGKVSISYGIYQTVQAFRKFGVNGG